MSSDERTAPRLPGSDLPEATPASVEPEARLRSGGIMRMDDRNAELHTRDEYVTLSEVIANLENIYPLPNNALLRRRSPLPLWYPRRPLQDITAVIDSIQIIGQEAAASKKVVKKGHCAKACSHIHDGRARICKPRVSRVLNKSPSLVASVTSRGMTLRQGFR